MDNMVRNTENLDVLTSASINLSNGKYTGNAEFIAKWIQEKTGGDLFLIKTKEPYSTDYDETVRRGQYENQKQIIPELANKINNLDNYQIIFLGYPNWDFNMPMAVYGFLKEYNLSGKIIIPFCTSVISGFSNSIATIKELQPDAKISENGLSVIDKQILTAEPLVDQWLKELGFTN